ncbi:MAG: glycosyltransferase [Gammaproteobacteria bacterium]
MLVVFASAGVIVGILFVSDVYFPRVNGVSTSIQTFRRDLAALGCETWLIAPSYPGAWQDDARILRQPSRYLVFDPEDRMMGAREARRAGLTLRGRIEAVHIHTPFIAHWVGKNVARELRAPVIETYHTFFEEYLHHYVPLLPRAVARAFARAASLRQCNAVDAVIAPSRQLADVLMGYGVVRPVHVIPTGLNLDEFAGGNGVAFRARHGIPGDRPVMLLVGRVAHEKNIGFLLRVLAAVRVSVPNVLFVIAGQGPAREALRRQVEAVGLSSNVLFVGYLDRRTELRDCYRAADVFVFASRTETQGLVLLESLALGVPVVSTAVLGTKEVLHGAAGAVVVQEDVGEFAAAVTRVLTQPDLRATLASAGRDFVAARWSSGEMARRLLRLYGDLRGVSGAAERVAAREDAGVPASEERLRGRGGR